MPNYAESPVSGKTTAHRGTSAGEQYDYITAKSFRAKTVKKCSISYIGEPETIALFINTLPFKNLAEDFELLFTAEYTEALDEQSRRLIQAKSRIIDLPPLSGFKEMVLETAKRTDAEYLVFANGPVKLDSIYSAIETIEEAGGNFATTPDKNIIAIRKTATARQEAEETINKEKHWGTIETFDAGLGHVLIIPDRIEMLRLLPQNGVVAEIGVFKGEFSAQIFDITKPNRLHLIDAWPDEMIQSSGVNINGLDACKFVQNKFACETGAGRVIVHRGLSAEAAQMFADEYFDWIYIDAGHSYEDVKSDLYYWYPKVKTGGFITGHDYIEKTWYGVVRAVNEFLKEKPLAFIALTAESHGARSWVLKKL